VERDGGKGRIRSFALGGLVGASAALAAVSRRKRALKRRARPRGLAAFESAPCHREFVEREDESSAP
jgi:hypothetical protein